MPMNPAVIGAIGGFASDLLGGLFGSSAQKKANRTNIQLQRENQDWMERMSNTQWQRGVDDMLAAGLNPMIAYSQGGASSPSSSAATVEPVDAMAKAATSAGSKAMQAVALAQGMANIDLTKANTEKAQAEAISARSTSARSEEMAHLNVERARKEIERVIQDFQLTEAQRTQIHRMLPLLEEASRTTTRLAEQQTSSAKTQERLTEYQLPSARAEAEVWEKIGAMGRGANIGANALQQIIAILRSIFR